MPGLPPTIMNGQDFTTCSFIADLPHDPRALQYQTRTMATGFFKSHAVSGLG
jgi:hypothetical protein